MIFVGVIVVVAASLTVAVTMAVTLAVAVTVVVEVGMLRHEQAVEMVAQRQVPFTPGMLHAAADVGDGVEVVFAVVGTLRSMRSLLSHGAPRVGVHIGFTVVVEVTGMGAAVIVTVPVVALTVTVACAVAVFVTVAVADGIFKNEEQNGVGVAYDLRDEITALTSEHVADGGIAFGKGAGLAELPIAKARLSNVEKVRILAIKSGG